MRSVAMQNTRKSFTTKSEQKKADLKKMMHLNDF